jgi:hypothetical protein
MTHELDEKNVHGFASETYSLQAFKLPGGYGMLRTSINMRLSVFIKTSLAAAQLGKTHQEVVKMLLRRVLHDIDRFQGGFTLVRYQPRNPEKQWKCFPISFRENENEFAKDLRGLSKFSVSYLVAIATWFYLEELLEDGKNRHKNAEFPHYAVVQRIENGFICWELYWGDPGPILNSAETTKIHRRTASL